MITATSTISGIIGTSTAAQLLVQGYLTGFGVGAGFFMPLIVLWWAARTASDWIYYKYFDK